MKTGRVPVRRACIYTDLTELADLKQKLQPYSRAHCVHVYISWSVYRTSGFLAVRAYFLRSLSLTLSTHFHS